MIDPTTYLVAADTFALITFPRSVRGIGGQELLAAEIAGALAGCQRVSIPFGDDTGIGLSFMLYACGFKVATEPHVVNYRTLPRADGLYFGTPTIVKDKALFPASEEWNKAKERATARLLVNLAEQLGYRTIVSGLGSGDVTVAERLEDMGGGEIVCMKCFNGFTDWLIKRTLK